MHPKPPRPMDEEERLAVLRSYRILDTDPEQQFDRIADMARRQFGVPVALVTFMDAERNFLKARGAVPDSESPRDISFCAYTILDDKVLVVPDAQEDARFKENPLVTDNPKFRFYAGAPLIAPSGHRIGTVCVFDTSPRSFGEAEQERLRDLADVVTDHLEMRRVVGRVHDEITSRRKAEAEARHLALHDTLTGLPNRAALQRHMADLQEQRPAASRHALYADLDSFKQANGLLGHYQADKILQRTAEVVKEELGAYGFVARISGDEFVAFMDGQSDEEINEIAHRVLKRLAEPMQFGSRILPTGISIGLAASDAASEPPDALLHRADLALTAAKRQGDGRLNWYDAETAELEKREKQLATDLREAIANGSIKVSYQTIHSATDRRIIGAEALARWTHPVYGEVSPEEFIPIAEETRQVIELGDLVIKRAIEDAKAWPDGFVAINLSPVQFVLADLSERLIRMLKEADFPTNRVQFEVTESLLLQDVDLARYHIEALRAAGVSRIRRLAMVLAVTIHKWR